jgi:tRNA threonylcarbamoyladenosine biosynthesis protein TsaE
MANVSDMPPIVESSEFLADEAATLAFAARFAALLKAPCSVALIGDLGAGKTTFVRGVLRALGVTGAIKSPTYALVESYDTAKGEVHHLDAYRIESVEDFEARGGFEYFATPSIRFVEWPERLDGAVSFDVELRFDFEGEGRRVTVSPLSNFGSDGRVSRHPRSSLAIQASRLPRGERGSAT